MNQEQLFNEIKRIVEESTEPYRTSLNKKIHVADISYKALQQSAPYLSSSQYTALIDYLETRFVKTNAESIDEIVMQIKQYKENNPGKGLRSRIYKKSKVETYIISGSYEALQTSLSRALKEASNLSAFSKGASLKTFTSQDVYGKTTVNIGHIAGISAITSSPLGTKLEDVLTKLSGLEETRIYSQVQKLVDRLNDKHNAQILYNLARGDVFKNEELASATVLVTLQSADLNNDFSKTEGKIARRLKALFKKPEVIKLILKAKGSNNILEDLAEHVMVNLGAARTTGSRHTKKPAKKSNINLSSKKESVVNKISTPRLRTLGGQFTSLASLQRLLEVSLIQKVKSNMGTGNRRDILNLRTGRFAESVRVERLSQSRDGMITAFYNYMKNPYATFSQGGRQESPKTRDPKVLIAKSIREIGATMVANRMRAVLV